MTIKTCRLEDCEKPRMARYLLCSMHRARLMRHGSTEPTRWSQGKTPTERYIERIILDDGCWLWDGSHTPNGYGVTTVEGGRHVMVHRFAYELFVGPIPEGLEIDHLCRTRGCSKFTHLEPVTRAENIRRGIGPRLSKERAAARTHCQNGHPRSEEGVLEPSGKWRCRACARQWARERRARLRAAAQLVEGAAA